MQMAAREISELQAFHDDALIFDIHFHPRSAMPALFRYFGQYLLRKTMPPLEDLSVLYTAGLDGCALAVIGDRQIGGLLGSQTISRSIVKQLNQSRAEIASCGGRIATTAEDIRAAKRDGVLSFLLSLEGGNVLRGLDDLEHLHNLGIRLVTLLHLNHNSIGRVGATSLNYWIRGCNSTNGAGLTSFGEACVRKMNELGIIIDVSHSHYCTVLDVARLSTQPIVASHTGTRAVAEFHRYLSDDEIKAIAKTGGVVGLWPMYYRGRGMAGIEDFKAHLTHILELVGEDYLAIGTDAQGIPGLMPGFSGMKDYITLTGLLFEAGLDEAQARKILGLNFLRVLEQTSEPD